MVGRQPHRIKTIRELHQFRGLPNPQHPLISVIDLQAVQYLRPDEPDSLLFDFYTISLKRLLNAKVKYGQQAFDFDQGIMSFTAPGQVIGVKKMHGSEKLEQSGWMLLVQPDFLWNTSLAKTIRNYDFFDYRINEALFLSEKEELIIIEIIRNIEREYHSNIDSFSRDVMVSQIELLLNYSNRFYNRQFITRQKASSDLLVKLEDLLTVYFDRQNELQTGLPTVKYLADNLNVSPNYLRSCLKTQDKG